MPAACCRRLAPCLLTLPLSAGLAAQVASHFDTDLEGWLITGDNAFAWNATAGNPGGCLDVNDLATGSHNFAVAPPSYLGDWSAATTADTLSFDVFLLNTSSGGQSTGNYQMRIAGPGGSARAIDPMANYPPLGIWTTYSVDLDPAQWVIESGTWPAILADVTSLRLNGEYVYGGEEVRIDNVELSLTPQTIFRPDVQDDFNTAGTGDWTFQGTSGGSNPGSGGNGHGYLLIADNSAATSYAFAPSSFRGDWSPLDGIGHVTLDLRVPSRSGSGLAVSDFIRLTGPGGQAHVSLDASALPAYGPVWKTFRYPIDAATWTLDNGTWPGLLQNITECRIQLEFFASTEQVGMDNFGRRMNGAPPIDGDVQVHDPSVSLTGYLSLVTANSVAHNPFDDAPYALVRATSGSGGGLYVLSGAAAGQRLQAYDRPAHLIFDLDGDAFISEDYGGNIYRYAQGSSSVWVSGFHSGDDDPFGMTHVPFGFEGPNVTADDMLVVDRGSGGADEIWAFSPDVAEGERLIVPDPGDPDWMDLTHTALGDVIVADMLDGTELQRMLPQGTLTPLPLVPPLTSVTSVVYDDVDERIYAADRGDMTVYAIDPLTGAVTPVADGFESLGYSGLEIDSPGRRLWVTDSGDNRVYELALPPATAPASYATFGQGCAGSVGPPVLTPALGQLPWIGSPFTIELTNLPPGNLALMTTGFTDAMWGGIPLPVNLAPYGLPGCELHVSPDFLFFLANPGGKASWTVTLPPAGGLVGFHLYSQGAVIDPGVNRVGIVVSNAGDGAIGQR